MLSRSSVTETCCTCASSCSSTSEIRSWVIGRGVEAPWSFIRIAAASGWPIQIGRNLLPSTVFSKHDRLLADHVEAHSVDDHLLHSGLLGRPQEV